MPSRFHKFKQNVKGHLIGKYAWKGKDASDWANAFLPFLKEQYKLGKTAWDTANEIDIRWGKK